MTKVKDPLTCPRCFAPLDRRTSPEGMCPKCLVAVAMGEDGKIRTASGQPIEAPPTVDDLQPHFPELDITSFIGRGGAGGVYRAIQRGLGRVIALKVLLLDPEEDPSFGERFVREARAMASLTHENIASVYDAGRAGPYWWLTMEFVDGPNLRQVLSGGALAPSEALDIAREICSALDYAHKAGVVHRDIKPENVLVTDAGTVKLVDFGLAKVVGGGAGSETLTRTSQAMGTWRYMAPEQLSRPLEVDHRADIFSLGVVLYELLTGEVPQGRYSRLSERAGLDRRLDDVVDRTLEQDPARRYQVAVGVRDDLDEIRSGAARAEAPVRKRERTPVNSGDYDGPRERRRTSGTDGCLIGCLVGAVIFLLAMGSCFVMYTATSVDAPTPESSDSVPSSAPR